MGARMPDGGKGRLELASAKAGQSRVIDSSNLGKRRKRVVVFMADTQSFRGSKTQFRIGGFQNLFIGFRIAEVGPFVVAALKCAGKDPALDVGT